MALPQPLITTCDIRGSPSLPALSNTLAPAPTAPTEYVHWFNHQRLRHRLGRFPPAEAEARYHAEHVTDPVGSETPEGAARRTLDGDGTRIMQPLKQAWWAPLAAVLALAQLWVALAFLYGEGTSNLLDAESTAAGLALGLGGAAALAAGLWVRLRAHWVGSALVVAGAALGAVWFWTVVMTPIAVVVIVGVVVSQLRSRHRRAQAPEPQTPSDSG